MRRTEEVMTTTSCDDRKDEQFISECQAALKHQQYMSVTCNGVSAVLNRHRLGSGGKGKCIEFEGDLLTPNEFQARCGKASSKDWKRSIRFRGRPLSRLIDQKILNCHAISCICAACSDDVNVQSPIRYFKKWNRKRKAQSVPSSVLVEFSKPTRQQHITDGHDSHFIQHLHSEDNRGTTELAKTVGGFKITETTTLQPSLVAVKQTVPSETVCGYKDLGECDVNNCITKCPDKPTELTMIGECHNVDTSRKDSSSSINYSHHQHKIKPDIVCTAPVLPVNPLSILHDEIVNDIVNEQKCWWHLETVAENLIRQTVALRAIVSQTKDASMSSKANILIQLRTILSSNCDRNASTGLSSTSDNLNEDQHTKSVVSHSNVMPGHFLPPTMRHLAHLNRPVHPTDWVYRRDSQDNPITESGNNIEHFTRTTMCEGQQRMSGLLAPHHPDAISSSFKVPPLHHSLDLSNVSSIPRQSYSAIPACFENSCPDPSLPKLITGTPRGSGDCNRDRSTIRLEDLSTSDGPNDISDSRTPPSAKTTSVYDQSHKRNLLKTIRRHPIKSIRVCRRSASGERTIRGSSEEASVEDKRSEFISCRTRDANPGRKRMPRFNHNVHGSPQSLRNLTFSDANSTFQRSLRSAHIRSYSVPSSLGRRVSQQSVGVSVRSADKCDTYSTAGNDKTDVLCSMLTPETRVIRRTDMPRSKSCERLSKRPCSEDLVWAQHSANQLGSNDKEQQLPAIGSRKRPTNRAGDKVDINFRDVCNLPDPSLSRFQRISRAKLNSDEYNRSERQIFNNDSPKRIRILHEYNETPDLSR